MTDEILDEYDFIAKYGGEMFEDIINSIHNEIDETYIIKHCDYVISGVLENRGCFNSTEYSGSVYIKNECWCFEIFSSGESGTDIRYFERTES